MAEKQFFLTIVFFNTALNDTSVFVTFLIAEAAHASEAF